MKTLTPKNLNTESAIARKLSLENVGCPELVGSYKGFRFCWDTVSGATREWGGKMTAHNASQRDLLLWVLSRV